LSNAVHRKDWASAFQIAFKLNKPRALLNVVNQLFLSVAETEVLSGDSEAQETLRVIVSKLQEDQLVKLFAFVCDWNTTSGEHTKKYKHRTNICSVHFVSQQIPPLLKKFYWQFSLARRLMIF
jgi:hypothetical protein